MNIQKIHNTTILAVSGIALGFLSIFAASAQAAATTQATTPTTDAHTIITILPKARELTTPITSSNLDVKVAGKETPVANLVHYDSARANLELVLLIDDSARSSLGLYLKEMSTFLKNLPPNVAVAVAYIENGNARFFEPFTLDHAAAAKTLRLPASPPGANADPYFALTALAKSWPSRAPGMRHEVVLVSNGISAYGGLRYDPENPYVTNATEQAQKSNMVVYSIFYKDRGLASRLGEGINSGQNYLIQLSEATGGELYYEGFDNPVSFAPFLNQIQRNLENQYELSLVAPPQVKDGLQSIKIKLNAPNTRLNSASAVLVGEPAEKH